MWITILNITALVYVLLAYLVAPAFWRHYEHPPAFLSAPKTTVTSEGFHGDPLNIGFVETDALVSLPTFSSAPRTPRLAAPGGVGLWHH